MTADFEFDFGKMVERFRQLRAEAKAVKTVPPDDRLIYWSALDDPGSWLNDPGSWPNVGTVTFEEPPMKRTKPSPAIFDYDTIREHRAVMFQGAPSGKVYGKHGLEHDFEFSSDNCHRCYMPQWILEDTDFEGDGNGCDPFTVCPGKPNGEKCVNCGRNAVHASYEEQIPMCWACGNDSEGDLADRRRARLHRIDKRVRDHLAAKKRFDYGKSVIGLLADVQKEATAELRSQLTGKSADLLIVDDPFEPAMVAMPVGYNPYCACADCRGHRERIGEGNVDEGVGFEGTS